MARVIDADIFEVLAFQDESEDFIKGAIFILEMIDNAPIVDAVPRGVYDQCAWERNVALEQLHDVELSLGEKTDDVVKVVRCKDCVYNENGQCTHSEYYDDTRYRPDYYCADGERKDNE